MRTVRFTQSMMPYRRGDVAEFEDAVAERIVRKGVAELVPDDETEAASSEERSAEPRRRRTARGEDPA
jgi:hypothetical protein